MRWWESVKAVAYRVLGADSVDLTMMGLEPSRAAAGDGYRGFSTSGPIDALLRGAWATNYVNGGPVSRDDAMTAAPVQRGRDVLCSIATLPLVNYRGLELVPRTFLEQPDPDVPKVVMMAQTIEDLLCDGVSWWLKTSLDYRGFPLTARRVVNVSLHPPASGRTPAPLPSGQDPRGASVWVDGHEVPAALMIRFDSPTRPLLATAHRTIRRALLLDALAAMYAENPRPLETFTDTDNQTVVPYDDDEVEAFLASYMMGRKRGGPAWIPKQVSRTDVSAPSPAELQLVELLRQVSLELALAMGLDPEDLGVSTTSRTYFNAQDRTTNKINTTYAPYMSAIADRLSMGDVTPRGQRVRWDLTDWLRPDPAGQIAYWEGLQRMGIVSEDWIARQAGVATGDRAPAAATAGAPTAGAPAVTAARVAPAITAARMAPLELPPAPAPAAALTFSAPPTGGWRFSVSDFAGARPSAKADKSRRTITGLAVPYGARAEKYGVGFRFRPGSLEYDPDNLNRLRAKDEHHTYIGVHESVQDTESGPIVTLKILDGPEGSPTKAHRDQVLMDADGGLYDGLSIGVDFDVTALGRDVVWDDETNTYDVLRATWLETSVTPDPAFTGARVTTVAASRTGEITMECQHCRRAHPAGIACATFAALSPAPPPPAQLATAYAPAGFTTPQPAPAPQPQPQPQPAPAPAPGSPALFSAEQLNAALTQVVGSMVANGQVGTAPAPAAAPVNPAALPIPGQPAPAFQGAQVREPEPYRLTFNRRSGEYEMRPGTHDLSRDMIGWFTTGDTAAHDRALSFMRAHFNVATTDVNELNPTRQRADMWVDQADYETPMWNMVYKGALTDITPFAFPKYDSSSGLVAAHTEGVEPSTGSYVVTNQTVSPAGYSGKARINREAWDQGGNPQISTLIWNQMVRGAREAWEALVVSTLNAGTFTSLATLTAGNADTGQTLSRELRRGLALLQFARGGMRYRGAFAQADLYLALADAETDAGEPLYPIVGPSNRNGQSSSMFGVIDFGGMPFIPAWALAAAGQTAAAKSYLIDPTSVHAWSSAPQRLTLDQIAVAYVDLGVWGYQAAAVADTNGVRTISWDPVA